MKRLFNGSTDELKARIWLLDLEPIIVKLVDKSEGEGWLLDAAFHAVEEYRRFLFLALTCQTAIVPTRTVDGVWHAHILDTMKYAEDCENTWGFFLHHFPYFGMRGADDRAALQAAGRQTAALYLKAFGVSQNDTSRSECQPSCGDNGTCNAVSNEVVIAGYHNMVDPNIRPSLSVM